MDQVYVLRHKVLVEGLSVREVARQLGVRPRDISDLFYARRLDDARCPIIGGRRRIPANSVPTIREALSPQVAAEVHSE